MRRYWHLAADLVNAVHQKVKAPRTDGECTETAGDTGSDERSTIE
jgi:hypothetical protein